MLLATLFGFFPLAGPLSPLSLSLSLLSSTRHFLPRRRWKALAANDGNTESSADPVSTTELISSPANCADHQPFPFLLFTIFRWFFENAEYFFSGIGGSGMDRGWKDREERKSEGLGVNLKFVGILEKNLWAKMYGEEGYFSSQGFLEY